MSDTLNDKFDILIYPNKVLSQKSIEVKIFDAELRAFTEKLTRTMAAGNGVGLSAVQVGDLRQVFVLFSDNKDTPLVYINPDIVEKYGTPVVSIEGCLSIPGEKSRLSCRYRNIMVSAFDINGMPFQTKLSEMDAIVFQHEYDHLQGVILFDRMTQLTKKIHKSRYMKRIRRSQIVR